MKMSRFKSLSRWGSNGNLVRGPAGSPTPSPMAKRFTIVLVLALSGALNACAYRDQVFLPPYELAGPSGPQTVWVHQITRDTAGAFLASRLEVLPNGRAANSLAAWIMWSSRSQGQRVSNLRALSQLLANGSQNCYIVGTKPLVIGFAAGRQHSSEAQIALRHLYGDRTIFNGVQAGRATHLMLFKLVLLKDWPPHRLLQEYEWIANPWTEHSTATIRAIKSFLVAHSVIMNLPHLTSARIVMIQQPWKTMGLKFHYP